MSHQSAAFSKINGIIVRNYTRSKTGLGVSSMMITLDWAEAIHSGRLIFARSLIKRWQPKTMT